MSEALFAARISPLRESSKLTEIEANRLVKEIRRVLLEAINTGAATLQDFREKDGSLGYFHASFKVYGREGQGCKTTSCSGKIARIVQAGRSSFFCRSCQR